MDDNLKTGLILTIIIICCLIICICYIIFHAPIQIQIINDAISNQNNNNSILNHHNSIEFNEMQNGIDFYEWQNRNIYIQEVTKKFIIINNNDNIYKKLKNQDCPICLNNFIENKNIIKTECEHFFHKFCIYEWIYNKHNSCPVCRDKLNTEIV
jgi:hypothetical protein